MEDKTNTNGLKVIIGILAVLLVALAVYTYDYYGVQKDIQKLLTTEKEEIQEELTGMIQRYDVVLSGKDSLNEQLLSERQRIMGMRDSINTLKTTVRALYRYRNEVKKLRKEKRELFLLADSLDQINQILILQRDAAETALQEQTAYNEKLVNQNLQLTLKVEKGAILEANNLRAEGVRIGGGGQVKPTNKARKTDKIRVCFSLGKNRLAASGDIDIYVRVATPDDILLGRKGTFEVDGESLQYSAKTRVYYEKESLDVCVFVDGTKQEFVKGTYLAAVYAGGKFIGETELYLR